MFKSTWFIVLTIFIGIRLTWSSSSGASTGQPPTVNCTANGVSSGMMNGRYYSAKSNGADATTNSKGMGALNSGGAAAGRSSPYIKPTVDVLVEQNVTLEGDGDEYCGSLNIFEKTTSTAGQSGKYVLTGQIWKNDDGKCVKSAVNVFVNTMGDRTAQCLLILYMSSSDTATKLNGEIETLLKDKPVTIFVTMDWKYSSPDSCTLSRSSEDDLNQQESLLNNFSRTSVLFVSVSFIILMVISLAWLVFYYVQRFRYAHAKDRLARRLFNAAKKALTKIPAKTLRQGDRELDSDCPVCIEPYHTGDVIRILPCKHVFHKTCVDPWLLEHRTCPMCKMDILKAFGYHFGHSEESVRDADQMSAGGQSSDGGSGGTGSGGRGGTAGFPISLPTESDLHDPFFPSPVPSPSLLQPVLHSSNAQSFTIIPLTVHRQHGNAGSAYASARGSDSSADSADNWVSSVVVQREHSAEVHHHGPAVNEESQTRISGALPEVDDNHNDTSKPTQRHSTDNRHRARESTAIRPSNIFTTFSCSTSNQQQRQPLFHSRSTGVLKESGNGSGTGDSCESDDAGTSSVETKKHSGLNGKRRTGGQAKLSAIVSRARSASQTGCSSLSNKARVAVSTTQPPLGVATTTRVVGRESVSSLSSSSSECVVVGVLNSSRSGPSLKCKRNRNTGGEKQRGSGSLESL